MSFVLGAKGAKMIKLFIVFVLGLFFGAVATCIAVVAGDAERCAECRRKIGIEREVERNNDT